jgi:uncharacterized protein YggE
MKRKIYFIAATMLLIVGNLSLYAQSAGNWVEAKNRTYETNRSSQNVSQINLRAISMDDPASNNLVLEANIMINVKASSYLAVFSVTQAGVTIEETDAMLNKRLIAFKEGIKRLGINEGDIHSDFISLVPSYETEFNKKLFSITANELPAGFQMKKNIHILFKNHNLIDAIITEAAKAEIYDLVKVDYNIENIKAAYDSLRHEAKNIINQKKLLYQSMGLNVQVVGLTEGYNVTYPIERYQQYTAFHTGMNKYDFNLKKNSTDNVVVKETAKPVTYYYDKIPSNQFDMVLNPDLAEPAVQFYYKMKVRILLTTKIVPQ